MERFFVNTANRACSLIYSFIKTYNQGVWLLPVNVCPDVPFTFHLAGVAFEFVDIDKQTYCIDENECLNRLMANKTKYSGIVYVRTYGRMYDTSSFVSECKTICPSLKIIDDRCLCIPNRVPSMYYADMVLFSTGHCKQIDLGGGGMAYYATDEPFVKDESLLYDGTDEEWLYKKAYEQDRVLNPIPKGWLNLETFTDWGDYMDIIESKVEERINRRNAINHIYSSHLPRRILLGEAYNDWRFNIVVPPYLKEDILQTFFNNGLFASNHYHSVNRLFDREKFPNSDSLFSSVINLFNDNNYTEEMALKTCNILATFPDMGG